MKLNMRYKLFKVSLKTVLESPQKGDTILSWLVTLSFSLRKAWQNAK